MKVHSSALNAIQAHTAAHLVPQNAKIALQEHSRPSLGLPIAPLANQAITLLKMHQCSASNAIQAHTAALLVLRNAKIALQEHSRSPLGLPIALLAAQATIQMKAHNSAPNAILEHIVTLLAPQNAKNARRGIHRFWGVLSAPHAQRATSTRY